ncbi:glycoside hydrolase family 3 C-terminal domain-containing protein [Arthrobacter jiangjiafuii]|uniref:Glycoside hydrolase family 3 C-terminal domain-containing protein n=1 Tax=Arthrobacter jiangjiafuii TaxID=2817475 RepID=A0A975M662_9MICC|nr:glycoside hydrolase family 3 C-terminal domain-containing protein [Arthrobacter jiangjiafuii]MBP3043667.1 glycoside hydrolase family 3 C-terminal domain-containing protein [Arthrobacter jiangjiafuii]QWC10703.1 glycoside hydrolase family 3 C-terminal domain-containing protein [Arthrobacter jiangjiafuii]
MSLSQRGRNRSGPTHRSTPSRAPLGRTRRLGILILPALLAAAGLFPAGAAAAVDPAARVTLPAQQVPPGMPWMDPTLPPEERADLVVAAMTLEQKVNYLVQSGGTGVPELGLPPLRSKDGCCGLALESTPTTALPVGVGLASTYDDELAQAYGAVAGEEARAAGYNTIAGPTMDLVRTPFNGRMWEDLGEDPLLSGATSANQVEGEQSAEVSALVKHYNLNNFETRRGHVDVQVDERTLQETYTRPWEKLISEADPGSVMCSFNKVNGEFACGNDTLLNQILKGQLGLEGFVSSDFNAAHSFADYEAGLDIAGPGLEFAGPALLAAVQAGTVSEERITDAARRLALTMFKYGIVDNPPVGSFVNPQPAEPPIPAAMLDEHAEVAAQVAGEAAVLLKNEESALPLAADTDSVAVIGSDADWYIDGGGSGAIPNPARLTTILDGITARAEGATVAYSPGTDPVGLGDTLPGPFPVPSGVLTNVNAEYRLGINNFAGEPELARTELQVNLRTGISADTINTSQVPGIGAQLAAQPISARWTGTLVPPSTGAYTLSLTHLGTARLFLNDAEVITGPTAPFGTQEAVVNLTAGQNVAVRIEYTTDAPNQFNGGLNDQPGAMMRFGWTPPADVLPPKMQAAVEAAADAAVAVVVVRDYTGEAADRGTLTLPQDQDRLIQEVAAVNPNTVVVLATSGPVTMPWIDDVPSVMEVWYPGQAQGLAVAGLLYGDINPSGKLPVTFPVSDAQAVQVASPSPFSLIEVVDPVVPYTEGVFVGYRGYLEQGLTPLFPFGHGLSYTEFDYEKLRIGDKGKSWHEKHSEKSGGGHMGDEAPTVTVRVRNTGDTAGQETVQVYVGNLPTDVPTPDLALAGYGGITLEPGESGTVEIELDARSLQYWDEATGYWVTPTGEVPIYVGSSVEDLRLEGSLSLGGEEYDGHGHGGGKHGGGHGHGGKHDGGGNSGEGVGWNRGGGWHGGHGGWNGGHRR